MALLAYLLFRVFIYPLSYLPMGALYLLSDFFCFLMKDVLHYRRSVIRSNLDRVFPDKTQSEKRKIEAEFYRHLCDLFIESLKSFTISEAEISRRFVMHDLDLLRAQYAKGQHAVLVLGHYNNWEWAALSSSLDMPGRMVTVYKPIGNPYFDRLVRKSRSRFSMQLVAVRDVWKYYTELGDHTIANCFVFDQAPSNPRKAFWLDFFGQDTPVLTGAERYAKEYDQAVIFARIHKVRRGYYEANLELVTDRPGNYTEGELTRDCLRRLEDQIRKEPRYWLWSHKRWKYSREELGIPTAS